ncbi:hypothetical protein M405DRAFT_13141 [Rhizopogon salebrosus TDB-379]|nr:hypothetical protein M405DRAFT_13141 [Rhizopogon salebrosus TDB-379]
MILLRQFLVVLVCVFNWEYSITCILCRRSAILIFHRSRMQSQMDKFVIAPGPLYVFKNFPCGFSLSECLLSNIGESILAFKMSVVHGHEGVTSHKNSHAHYVRLGVIMVLHVFHLQCDWRLCALACHDAFVLNPLWDHSRTPCSSNDWNRGLACCLFHR